MRKHKTPRLQSGALAGIMLFTFCVSARAYANSQPRTIQESTYETVSVDVNSVEVEEYVTTETVAESEPVVELEAVVDTNINAVGKPKVSRTKSLAGRQTSEATGEMADTNPTYAIGDYCSLPELPTNVKACTDYRCYGIKTTPHWRLQQQAWTDEWGLRRFNDDYIVGLGTHYSTDIGDRFEVTLDTGRVLTIILGDNKADRDTDETNRYKPCAYYTDNDANVLEFIVDFEQMPDWVYARGTIDCIDEFAGNLVSMKYLGRDTSGDWDSYI